MLQHGSDLTGIVKRSYWCHFTHDQTTRKNASRVSLEEKGPSTLFATETTIEESKMTAHACRTCTKNMSLTMAKKFEGIEDNCVIDTQNKNKRNKN